MLTDKIGNLDKLPKCYTCKNTGMTEAFLVAGMSVYLRQPLVTTTFKYPSSALLKLAILKLNPTKQNCYLAIICLPI